MFLCYNLSVMFENIKFNGTFRSYQQKILDGADEYLADGKINIVAAPGSGKTILGLELIRRLGKPCLILSPTTTIRQQWGERFTGSFCGDGQDVDLNSLLSFDLKNPKPITSITYQALYSASAKVKCLSDEEEIDNTSVDIFKLIEDCKIGTLCLDEAHHLQNEWQKALEEFISRLGGKCTVISLTATPPYDASGGEWKRYISVCGEIDEEIFVPELVKTKTLCPHQDYIYFSYPDQSEEKLLEDYRGRVLQALEELKDSPALKSACKNLDLRTADINGWIGDGTDKLVAVCGLFKFAHLECDKQLLKQLNFKKSKEFDLERAEFAINFLLSEDKLLFDNEREELKQIFASRSLTERGKVALQISDKLKKCIIASAGKLKSIAHICNQESNNLGKELRLLILTDYIKKESLSCVGTDKEFNSISLISVFETARRACTLPIAALSGTLVILPVACSEGLKKRGVQFTYKKLADEAYAEFNFKGGNRDKVNIVGGLFERGEVNVLVGTKSLLGEGWDSPCVNALILASFVGSFMLSNQMRGRAIRVDKNNPEKTANIWHLCTLEPPDMSELTQKSGLSSDKNNIKSADFEMLKRRFDCFVGPDYDGDKISSGIERISTIRPPFDIAGVERINAETCARAAASRKTLKDEWEAAMQNCVEMHYQSVLPKDRKYPAFTIYDIGFSLLILLIASIGVWLICAGTITAFGSTDNPWLKSSGAIIVIICWFSYLALIGQNFIKHLTPKSSLKTINKCLVATLKELHLISSQSRLKVETDKKRHNISIELTNATLRDQKTFQTALCEMYSPIANPRYIILPKRRLGGYDYKRALACPAILGAKQEYAQAFAKKLKRATGRVEVVYTRTEKGRAFIKKCKRRAFVYHSSADIYLGYGN